MSRKTKVAGASSSNASEIREQDAPATLVPKLRFPEFREMKDWSATTVGRISNTVIAGGTPSTSEKKFWGGEIRWMNSGELNDKKVSEVQSRITREGLNNSSTKVIPPRCVLIGLAGQGKTRGTVAMNLVELCTNQSIASIFPNDSVFNSEFLYHDLDKRYDELRRLSAGGEGRGGLNLQIIKSLRVLLPSLPEQQKIAECLSSLDELMAAQARKVDALKTHKRGLMQQLFPKVAGASCSHGCQNQEQDAPATPRLRFPEFQNAEEWEETKLGQLGELVSGLTYSPDDVRESGLLVLRSSNVQNGEIALGDNVYVNPTIKGANLSQPNDILICVRNGSKALIGKCALIPEGMPLCTHGAFMTVFRARAPKFVFQLFQTDRYQKQVAGDLGATINSINGGQFLKYKFAVPKPAEQQRIADCLSSLDDLILAETQKHEAFKTHKRGLMQQLFPSPEETP